MRAELREKILAYNKALAERKEKAEDLDVILTEILKLPPGLLPRVLTDKVRAIFEKYGINVD